MANELDFQDFSNGQIDYTDPSQPVWEGTGAFDKLMEAINGNIKIQYETGRIKGPEYANVYLGSMQTAVSEAFKYLLQKQLIEKDLELKDRQIKNVVLDNAIKYVQQVKLDKETAALGLDDVVKMKETSRDGDYVYQVSYVQ